MPFKGQPIHLTDAQHGDALDMTPKYWLNLQRMYDLDVARADEDVTTVKLLVAGAESRDVGHDGYEGSPVPAAMPHRAGRCTLTRPYERQFAGLSNAERGVGRNGSTPAEYVVDPARRDADRPRQARSH